MNVKTVPRRIRPPKLVDLDETNEMKEMDEIVNDETDCDIINSEKREITT